MYFREPWAGGQQGKRRLRELQQRYALRYEYKPHPGSETNLYRLTYDPFRSGSQAAAIPPTAQKTFAFDGTGPVVEPIEIRFGRLAPSPSYLVSAPSHYRIELASNHFKLEAPHTLFVYSPQDGDPFDPMPVLQTYLLEQGHHLWRR